MAERRQTPITMFDRRREAPPLEWEWVTDRLRDAQEYWLVTAGDRPAARPVWGVWMEERLLLTLGSHTHDRNVRRHDAVSVHLPDTLEVVIVEGRGVFMTDQPTLDRMVEVYNPKYQWNFEPGKPGDVLEVVPTVVLAWTTVPSRQSRGTPFPVAAGRWEFS